MVLIECNNCRRQVKVNDHWDRNATCNVCGGFFAQIREYQQQNNGMHAQNTFNQLGNQIRGNMPHIMLGNNGISTQNSQSQAKPPVYQNIPQILPPTNANLSPFEKEERLYRKIRSIGFIIVIALVAGYAVWRIFFG